MEQLEWQITGTHSAELECAQVLDPNTPPEVRIRSLEHKIATVQLQIQGVQIVVKQYEATLQPLRDEWITYDAKVWCSRTVTTLWCSSRLHLLYPQFFVPNQSNMDLRHTNKITNSAFGLFSKEKPIKKQKHSPRCT